MGLAELTPAARLWVAASLLAAVCLLLQQVPLITAAPPLLLGVFLLLAGVACQSRLGPPLSWRGSVTPAAVAVQFAALVFLGKGPAMLTAVVGGLAHGLACHRSRLASVATPLGIAGVVLSLEAAAAAYGALGGTAVADVGWAAGLEVGLLAAATVHVAAQTATAAASAALVTRAPADPPDLHISWMVMAAVTGVGTACAAALLATGPGRPLLPLLALPPYLAGWAARSWFDRADAGDARVVEATELHLSTIEALALAIDAKDQTATLHVRRVQVYATGLARALGMSAAEVQGVRLAALLHDIGKLAIPEHILSKPGPLTPEEFQKVQTHPQLGAEIIGSVAFPYPVAPLILGHHERWDGHGYPNGWKGERIPLGARILTVVDYFDALTSERPYHAAMTAEQAVATIRREAGTALDPQIVELFVRLLPQLRDEARAMGEPARQLSFAAGAAPGGSADAGSQGSVFQDIALAHREIYALYQVAQSMGTSLGVPDTMAIIASKLRNLVPFSTCALFLYQGDTDALHCRFATGIDAELLQQITLRNGEGVVGWVGCNARPLVNARPSADLEAAGLRMPTVLSSALVCPLLVHERLVGALAVYQVQPGGFTDDHRRLLDRVCEQAAGVVNNALVFEQTKKEALTDPLTGLPNTRFMFVHLTRELARAERLGTEVSVLIMDLDEFKEINDRYGHHVGDRALREIARALRAAIRPYDSCVRYAGDEFVVVLSGCGPAEAESKRLELQKAIEEIPFEVRPGRHLRLGSSFGSASFPKDGRSYEVLLATADRRMYEDKAARKRTALQGA